MGAQIVMEITSKTSSLDTKHSVSASLEASWNGIDKSASGSASFQAELAKSESLSKEQVTITQSGQDRGKGVESLSIQDANQQLIHFASIAPEGTGIATILHRFDRHPQYVDIVNNPNCQRGRNMKEELVTEAENIIYQELVVLSTVRKWLTRADVTDYVPRDEVNHLMLQCTNDAE